MIYLEQNSSGGPYKQLATLKVRVGFNNSIVENFERLHNLGIIQIFGMLTVTLILCQILCVYHPSVFVFLSHYKTDFRWLPRLAVTVEVEQLYSAEMFLLSCFIHSCLRFVPAMIGINCFLQNHRAIS